MSCFIVSPKCMDRVVSLILDEAGRSLDRFGGVDLSAPEAGAQVAAQLYAMNLAAFQARYHENPDINEGLPAGYRFVRRSVSVFQGYKSMACLLYQCAEGDVPESPLYRQLERFHYNLADHYMSATPEYDAADWD